MTDSALQSVLRLLQSAQIVEARLAGEFSSIHGISVNELFLLMQLEQAPLQRLPRVELAKRLNTSASTVTRMAAPMEKLGLVSRQSDARDARLAFVVLTPAGATRVLEARATLSKQAGYVFRDRWRPKEIEQLSQLLGRLVAGTPGDLT
ncbi:MAG: MarR family transcriptional regulator [Gammaproteobacteria bacterium]|nr:MarR family transcriptional regulator [Gammaproteobacteria bacterium]